MEVCSPDMNNLPNLNSETTETTGTSSEISGSPERKLRPLPGPQYAFFETTADIAIYGGAAGGGKTWALQVEPLRHVEKVAGFGGVIFRRTSIQIRNEGGDVGRELRDLFERA